MAILKRVWLPTLMVVAVVIGVATVSQLRSVFGSDGGAVVTPVGSDTAAKFNPKVVVYEVFGTGSTAVVNYTDLNGLPPAHRRSQPAVVIAARDDGPLGHAEPAGTR